jgi:hypothetical protein
MVNLMANFGTKLILMVNLMREKFNPLTISELQSGEKSCYNIKTIIVASYEQLKQQHYKM